MEARCQCGMIQFTTPISEPTKVFVCHCLECRYQSSSAFGMSTMFPAFPLPDSVKNNLKIYTRETLGGYKKNCYFCKTCGSRIMHENVGGKQVTIKAGCLEGLNKDMYASACHIWTKRAVIPIPDGVEQYDEEPPDDV